MSTAGRADSHGSGDDRNSTARYGADRYAGDVLAGGRPARREIPSVEAADDLVLEDAASGFVGLAVGHDTFGLTLEDRHGNRRVFPWNHNGFLLDGARVRVMRPARRTPVSTGRTASGSIAVAGATPRVARASRILVEGLHDCELVEAVWGEDLRVEGVVVEQLEGADNLADVVRSLRPGPGRRLGVLLDHLVAGSKESRIAAAVQGPHVRVVGHPYVDIWQAVKPARLGLDRWPDVPRGMPWKEGVAAHLGAPDTRTAWLRIRSAVRSWTDLEPALLGPVEELIDFVTAD